MKKSAWIVVAIGTALIVGYILLPATMHLELGFWTRAAAFDVADADGAILYINDRPVGDARVSLSLQDFQHYLTAGAVGGSWPPDEAPALEFDSKIAPDLSFDVRVRTQNDNEPRIHTVFVRVAEGRQVVQGYFHVKAVNARGTTAYCAGCKLTSKSVEDKRRSATVQVQLHF